MSEGPAEPLIDELDAGLLDAASLRFFEDDAGALHVDTGIGERFGPLQVQRCRPLTRPRDWILLRELENEREVGIIPALDEVAQPGRAMLERQLEREYVRTRVLAIHHAEAKFGIITWDLETEMGRRTVYLRDRQNIRSLPDGRVILLDIHDGRYEIPPLEQLDEQSRHWLEIEM